MLVGAPAGSTAFNGQMQQSVEIPGTESQTAIDMLQSRSPRRSGASARIIYVAPAGSEITDFEPEIASVVDAVTALPHVVLVGDPFGTGNSSQVSADCSMAHLSVQDDVQQTALGTTDADAVQSAGNAINTTGLTVVVAGVAPPPPAAVSDATQEVIGLAIAFLILALTFRSLLAAGCLS